MILIIFLFEVPADDNPTFRNSIESNNFITETAMILPRKETRIRIDPAYQSIHLEFSLFSHKGVMHIPFNIDRSIMDRFLYLKPKYNLWKSVSKNKHFFLSTGGTFGVYTAFESDTRHSVIASPYLTGSVKMNGFTFTSGLNYFYVWDNQHGNDYRLGFWGGLMLGEGNNRVFLEYFHKSEFIPVERLGFGFKFILNENWKTGIGFFKGLFFSPIISDIKITLSYGD